MPRGIFILNIGWNSPAEVYIAWIGEQMSEHIAEKLSLASENMSYTKNIVYI